MRNIQLLGLILVSFGAGLLLSAFLSAGVIRALVGVLLTIIGIVLCKKNCC